jgi:hypothetical protein
MASDARARLSEMSDVFGGNGMLWVFHGPDDPLAATTGGRCLALRVPAFSPCPTFVDRLSLISAPAGSDPIPRPPWLGVLAETGNTPFRIQQDGSEAPSNWR